LASINSCMAFNGSDIWAMFYVFVVWWINLQSNNRSIQSHFWHLFSWVYGSMTNNNGFWIGWLDLFTPSCTVTHNDKYNSSQSIFNRTLLPWFPRTRSILVLVLWLASDLWLTYIVLRQTHRNTSVVQQRIYANHIENTASSIVVFTVPLHRSGSYPIVACVFVVTGMCLPSCCPATVLYVTIWFTLAIGERGSWIMLFQHISAL
jgi:hypothetical protein